MKKISERIKELRNEKNISQKELAEKIGVTQQMICKWEKHGAEPTASNIIALAEYFNVCADYLLGRQDWY